MDTALERVEFKYFESGHTFMSADSFHSAVESSMRRERIVTFDDFKAAVSKATKKVDVLDMQVTNFFQTELNVTQHTLNQIHPRPYIENIRKIVFQKGKIEIGYAEAVNSRKLTYCTLFSKKQQKIINSDDFELDRFLRWQKSPRGIDEERKKKLLSTVLDVVPENKRPFFENLPTQGSTD